MADEQEAPEVVLYPRDPTLDPQLVWKEKDEQDRRDLSVPVVPIYIQEKIEPKALIDDLRAQAAGKKPQIDLFGSAFGTSRDLREQIDFYQHGDQWANRMILGDSLVVMASLARKEGLKGKVQMIYMDPPYGIDFASNFQVSTRRRDMKDGRAEDLVRQPEQIKAFRDTWRLGIHSYLAYLRDRLCAAHDLLSESGSIFVQIGEDNVHLVRCLLDEVFGGKNFCSHIVFRKKTMPLGSDYFEQVCDHILWYAKDKDRVKSRPLMKPMSVAGDPAWSWVETPDGARRKMSAQEIANHSLLPEGSKVYRLVSMLPAQYRRNQDFQWEFEGRLYDPPSRSCWKTGRDGMRRMALAGRLQGGTTLQQVLFHDDYPYTRLTALWGDTGGASDKVYVVQTSSTVVQRCVLAATDPGDLVLDPTCGSGTTAAVAEQWGRRWIVIDTSRVALALARARLACSAFLYYILRDSPEGHRLASAHAVPAEPRTDFGGDVAHGFVYRRAPHITLKDIANNEEIDLLHARFEGRLAPVRATLNNILSKTWEDWEIPRDVDATWPAEAKAAHAAYWQLRRARQKEIDASIARSAESEILYDQPYEDPKRIRVAGPFTVEGLSPHRVLDPSVTQPRASGRADPGAFVTTILDNLKKAGVQNTIKNERLVFDRMSPFAGQWIHAEGELTDKGGAARRVAISIGPEHGTVSPMQVRAAVNEAARHFDLVVVCGFAFDALAYEAAKELSQRSGAGAPSARSGAAPRAIPVLLSRMNADLSMGDELLKKTGAANLFMVFGAPDITLSRAKDGKLTVEIKGLDVYDPTTGEIRSHTTDDIACWFIDTDYNSESFFVRHAYFTGGRDPYERLKRALKAEIDEATWASLYTTKSRPFDPPSTGLIAVKVINHYGDEILKVYKTA